MLQNVRALKLDVSHASTSLVLPIVVIQETHQSMYMFNKKMPLYYYIVCVCDDDDVDDDDFT